MAVAHQVNQWLISCWVGDDNIQHSWARLSIIYAETSVLRKPRASLQSSSDSPPTHLNIAFQNGWNFILVVKTVNHLVLTHFFLVLSEQCSLSISQFRNIFCQYNFLLASRIITSLGHPSVEHRAVVQCTLAPAPFLAVHHPAG